MRLNFSNASEDMIVEGIRRLSVTLKQRLVKQNPVFSVN
jgi:DNA-binding transcriptional MocR family regulator